MCFGTSEHNGKFEYYKKKRSKKIEGSMADSAYSNHFVQVSRPYHEYFYGIGALPHKGRLLGLTSICCELETDDRLCI